MILDSNIIVYAARSDAQKLQDFIESIDVHVSEISYVEVLGFSRLTQPERRWFADFFETATWLHISRPILDEAVRLRQQRAMKLGDSLIAATALAHNLELVTHNTCDFSWITGLRLVDPLLM